MPEEYICEYCKKSFSSGYNLNIHKKTTKACIDIQRKQFNLDIPEPAKYVCEDCGQSIILKSSFEVHLELCKARKSKLIDQTIATLQKEKTELSLMIQTQTEEIIKNKYELQACSNENKRFQQTISSLQDQINSLLCNANLLEKTIVDLQNKLHTQAVTNEHIISQAKKDKNKEVMKVKIEKFAEIEKVKTERYIETKRLQAIISEKDNYIQSLLASKLMNQSSS